MVEKLDEFNFRQPRGQFAQLLDGSVWKIIRDQDFPSYASSQSLMTAIRAAARGQGLLVRSKSLDSNTVVMQAHSPDPDDWTTDADRPN